MTDIFISHAFMTGGDWKFVTRAEMISWITQIVSRQKNTDLKSLPYHINLVSKKNKF